MGPTAGLYVAKKLEFFFFVFVTISILRFFLQVGQWNNSGVVSYTQFFPKVEEWPKLRVLTLPVSKNDFKKFDYRALSFLNHGIS